MVYVTFGFKFVRLCRKSNPGTLHHSPEPYQLSYRGGSKQTYSFIEYVFFFLHSLYLFNFRKITRFFSLKRLREFFTQMWFVFNRSQNVNCYMQYVTCIHKFILVNSILNKFNKWKSSKFKIFKLFQIDLNIFHHTVLGLWNKIYWNQPYYLPPQIHFSSFTNTHFLLFDLTINNLSLSHTHISTHDFHQRGCVTYTTKCWCLIAFEYKRRRTLAYSRSKNISCDCERKIPPERVLYLMRIYIYIYTQR